MGRNDELSQLAHRYIPAGCHTYSKGRDQFPANAPAVLTRGQGCTVWDAEEHAFLDWGMGLRSVTLGHAFEPVLEAVRAQLLKGANFTRVSDMEILMAQRFVELIPAAEMVKFSKNGSDVTTAAVRLARAFTGRDLVALPRQHPFFSVDDWFIGTTPCNNGIPEAGYSMSLGFDFNDLASVQALFDAHPDGIACVITECCSFDPPREDFLHGLRDLCTKHGTLLIADEMITGFRWDLRGAQTYYGIEPDMATFGKGVANGFSVSALTGRREILELGGLDHDRPRTFLLSATHGGETHALAAAQASIDFCEEHDVCGHIWKMGRRLVEGYRSLAAELGLEDRCRIIGEACSPAMTFHAADGAVDMDLRTLYLQEMVKQGILIPYISISWSHKEAEVDRTLEASRAALKVCAEAVERGSSEGLLVGAATRPVFRRFN